MSSDSAYTGKTGAVLSHDLWVRQKLAKQGDVRHRYRFFEGIPVEHQRKRTATAAPTIPAAPNCATLADAPLLLEVEEAEVAGEVPVAVPVPALQHRQMTSLMT